MGWTSHNSDTPSGLLGATVRQIFGCTQRLHSRECPSCDNRGFVVCLWQSGTEPDRRVWLKWLEVAVRGFQIPMKGHLNIMLLAVAILVIGLFTGSVLTALSQPSSTTIHACVNRNNGGMRMAQSPEECRRTEYAVSWQSFDEANLDETYVNEDQADSIGSSMIVDGEIQEVDLSQELISQLDADYVNADESNSVSSDMVQDGTLRESDFSTSLQREYFSSGDLYTRSSSSLVVAPGQTRIPLASCDTGDIAISGGGRTNDWPTAMLSESELATTSSWQVSYYNTGSDDITVSSFVMCIDQ